MKDKLLYRLKLLLPPAGLFILLFSLLRLYEYFSIRSKAGDISTFVLEAVGWIKDFPFLISIASIIVLICFLFSLINNRLGYIISAIFFTLIIISGFAIAQYFSVTLIPLSADLYGYTLNDIKTTVTTSGDFSIQTPVVLFLFILLSIAGSIYLYKNNYHEKIPNQIALGCILVFSLSWALPHARTAEDYERDIDYYVAANKSQYFIKRSADYFSERSHKTEIGKDVYPFLHKATYPDSLGKYFNKAEKLPNFVFIVVEGLGRDFTGPDANFGGFTPFLDSLSDQSLYWENFLSNAGRTFGALPSIFGSLPYGRNGFMSYGTAMPNHQTLISLLKPYGYQTNFFFGGNSNFDNQDIFLEDQGIDYLLDESKFPPAYQKMNANKEGFTWGYGDREVFSYAQEVLAEQSRSPHLDIYFTLSTHEPFKVPDEIFTQRFDERLKQSDWNESKKKLAQENAGIFSCLLYTDDAIRQLINAYKKRADFKNTIFIITGDHRLIPIPPDSKIARFHVPFIIYSPLLKETRSFSSLSVHSSITPTFLSFLSHEYNLSFPKSIASISNNISVKEEFSSDLNIALIRNKNETKDYIDGEYFLSEERLFQILPKLELKPVINETIKRKLQEELKSFNANSIHAVENNRLDTPAHSYRLALFEFTAKENKYLDENHISQLTVDNEFFKARENAFDKKYFESRAILKFVLNKSPNYHDARILLGRTYAWNGQYDSARMYFNQVLMRAANYPDAYAAFSDLEYWDDHLDKSMELIQTGLKYNPNDEELLARDARTLLILGKKKEAKKVIERVLTINPKNELAQELLRKLKSK